MGQRVNGHAGINVQRVKAAGAHDLRGALATPAGGEGARAHALAGFGGGCPPLNRFASTGGSAIYDAVRSSTRE